MNTKGTSSQSMHKFLIHPGGSIEDIKEYCGDVQYRVLRGPGKMRYLCTQAKVG